MRWAKIEDNALKYPTAAEFAGVPNWPSFGRLLKAHGYMPLVGEPEEREGYEAVAPSEWHVVGEGGDAYIQIDAWEYELIPMPEPVPTPVVRYSKYKIQLACQSKGLWANVKEFIANSGKKDSWDNIIDIRSDNEELMAVLPDIRTAFGSDVVDAVLAESVADGE